MGGNALKNCTTRRYAASEYWKIVVDVLQKLAYLFPKSKQDNIRAYRHKKDFGDLDVLVESDTLPSDWVAKVIETFNPKEYVKNGNVLSLEYKEFQIDLIATTREQYHTSLLYFGYNDLGNLIGRIAHSMGLKLGHDGLSYNWRVETYQFKNEIISTDWEVICNVLGLSYERYCEGFDELEDIFKFVVASPFFNKDIYLLENRNNYARTRDKKRPTYNAFLKWIEDCHSETKEQVANSMWDDMYKESSGNKNHWLDYLFMQIPGFEATYKRVQAEWAETTEYKSRYNGDLVRGLTGLDNRELGNFMRWMKETQNADRMKKDILNMNVEVIPVWIKYWKGVWEKQNGN